MVLLDAPNKAVNRGSFAEIREMSKDNENKGQKVVKALMQGLIIGAIIAMVINLLLSGSPT